MDQISKFEIVFLVFNTTSYTIAEAISPNSPFINNTHIKGTAFLFVMLIDYAAVDLLFGQLMKTTFNEVTIISILFMGIYILLEVFYKEKIEVIAKNYGSYYSFFIPILFVLFSIGSAIYIFTRA
ncbi:hypothetical protein [Mucilaginibacter sp. L196]|uniref:hypothetical protein n=1 Tax=Mucilaginibacter sp. L196 TaxID=1641870 RepID=UPI00131B3B75|nr:hypothetical protein [Mucilaginibacter sp. L196]